ncbi:hypothetical protein [Catenulispora pinisilvae]|uniref:hypothetical protein n=1 Tax=Catenulispora pinisilvae TaxID=2705253 RepID=UPI00189243A8|nr:hypothetical protein [Catenulispora pinisilvae]
MRTERLAGPEWSLAAGLFPDFDQELVQEGMERAKADAEPVVAELIAADQPVTWFEDELCRRLGGILAAQDALTDALRTDALGKSGQAPDFDAYGPEVLLDAFNEVVSVTAFKAIVGVDDPVEQNSTWRLLLALARIVPHPDSQTPVGAVKNLRESVPQFPEASIDCTPTGSALWCRDVYGTRFAITAPFTAAEGTDRWYLWDIDVCSGEPHTVGAGYFADAEQAFTAWQSAVGPDATSRSRFEPVSDADLAARILPVASVPRDGGESEPQLAEFHRCRRLAQELRASDRLGGGARTQSAWPEQQAVQDAWIAEFVTWRAEHRPGQSAVPEGFTVDNERIEESEVYNELALTWLDEEFPDLAHTCSPHQIALTATAIRDLYDADFAHVLLRLLPDLTTWLAERMALPQDAADQVRASAEHAARPDFGPDDRAADLMAQIRE